MKSGDYAGRTRGVGAGLLSALAIPFGWLTRAYEVRSQRRKLYAELTMLDDLQLAHLGLHRRDIPKFVKSSFRAKPHVFDVQPGEPKISAPSHGGQPAPANDTKDAAEREAA